MLKRGQCFALLFIIIPLLAQGQFRFIENKNQWDAQANYRAELPGGYLFLEDQGLSYLFYDPSSFPQHHGSHAAVAKTTNAHNHTGVRGHVVKINFLGSQTPTGFQTAQQQAGHYNFLRGTDRSKWGQQAKAFGEVTYQNLYDNIDLKFYNYQSDLKYEFIVHPQADASAIQIAYEGHDDIYLDDENLYIKTSVNAFREAKPYCYQLIEGMPLEIESSFKLEGDVLTFDFPQGYDPKYPLIIDPTLIFATFSGSFQDNWGFTAAPDDEGHLYAGGMTWRTGDFPTTAGAFQEDAPTPEESNSTDIGIIKYSPDGTAMEYATYLGGVATDLPHSLIVNSQNQLIILGSTSSADFPTSNSAYDDSFNGGTRRDSDIATTYEHGSDLFITILNFDGSDIIGSTFFGGSANDGLNPRHRDSDLTFNYGDEFRGDIVLDSTDNIYICSVTNSADIPTTATSYQEQLQGSLDGV